MRKRILFISDHGDPLQRLGGKQAGGQNNYVKQLALALSNKNIPVDVVTHWCDPETKRIERFGRFNRVIRIEAGHKGFVSKNNMFQMLPQFYQEIKKTLNMNAYSAIHSHYWLSGLLGKRLADEYQIPLIHTSHSLGIAKAKATGKRDERRLEAEKYILEHADQIIATTKSEKDLILEFADKPAPVHVIPIGVDKAFTPDETQTAPTVSEEPVFVFAGRLEETKGIYTLLEAFHILSEKESVHAKPKLILAGGEADQINFREKLPSGGKLREAAEGLEDRVQFIGPQSQETLASLFQRAVAAIVPSYYESFGMVAAEAQACGCPVIASAVGGLANIVKDGQTGLLVEPKDPHDLALAMEAILTNNVLAKRMGRNAASYAQATFKWPSITDRVAGLYEEGIYAQGDSLLGN